MERKILHIDMNNFYASVELLTRPDLRDKPVIVGGDRSERHGIVLAKNEIAKSFGVVTAETIYQALQKCPHAVLLPPNREAYKKYSLLARQMYLEYSERVEPFGPDEAWIDVSHQARDGVEIANEIRQRIKSELGLRVSVGVSWNKTFAKMGSDYKKPDATTEITRENYQDLLWPLPVGNFLFVGEVSRKKLRSVGIMTIGDLAKADPEQLSHSLGKMAYDFVRNANGGDEAIVLTEEERGHQKSIGAMETTDHDLYSLDEISALFEKLAHEVSRRAKSQGLKGRTVSITVKFNDFEQKSRQKSQSFLLEEADEILQLALNLFDEHFRMETRGIRLLGLSLEQVEDASVPEQVSLFDLAKGEGESERQVDASNDQPMLDNLLDELQKRFGKESIRRGIDKVE